MSEALKDRPYDTDQLQKLTKHIEQNGPVIDAPAPPKPEIVAADINFEHYPSVGEEAKTALSGLARIFTAKGREERAKEKEEKARHRQTVADHVADRIENPRKHAHPKSTEEAREMIGWVGTHKREVEQEPKRKKKARKEQPSIMTKTNFSDLGGTLFPSAQPKPTVKNTLRPATQLEISVDKRLERHTVRRRRFENEKRWLENSHGDSMKRGHHHLSRPERIHMRSVSKRIEKLQRKSDRAQRKFEIAREAPNGPTYHWRAAKLSAQEIARELKEKVTPSKKKRGGNKSN